MARTNPGAVVLNRKEWWRQVREQVNRGKKQEVFEACRAQAELIINLEEPKAWSAAGWISLAPLANDFSQLIGKDVNHRSVYRQALAKIGYWVASDQTLRNPKPRNLAGVAGGLAKGLDAKGTRSEEGQQCTRGLLRIAKEVSSWALQERNSTLMDAELEGFTEIDLAQLCNGLSKLADQVKDETGLRHFRLAMGEIARALVHRKISKRDELRAFEPRALAMLANGLSKVDEDEAGDCAAGLKVLGWELARRGERGLRDFEPRDLAMLVNGLSKVEEAGDCAAGLKALGRELARRGERGLRNFESEDLAMLAHGLSKVEEEEAGDCAAGLKALGRELARRRDRGLRDCEERHLAMLANGLSKVEEDGAGDCATGLKALGRELARRGVRDFESKHLAMLANGLSKVEEEEAGDCAAGLKALGRELARREAHGLWDFEPIDLAMLANGLSKVEEEEAGDCAAGLEALGREVARRGDDGLRDFAEMDLAMLANGLSKVEEEEAGDCAAGLKALGREVARRGDRGLRDLGSKQLAMLANGLSKVEEEEAGDCAAGLKALGRELARRGAHGLRDCDSKQLAMLANGLSKVEEDEAGDCAAGLKALGRELARRGAHGLWDFEPIDLAMLANGLSTVKEEEEEEEGEEEEVGDCAVGLRALGREVARRGEGGLRDFDEKQLAMLANALSRPGAINNCADAMSAIARGLGAGGHPYARFDARQMAKLANALSRHALVAARDEDEQLEALMQGRLHELAAHLAETPERIGQFDTWQLSMVLKALDKAQLHEDLGMVCKPALERLEVLRQDTGFRADNLETMGNLCVGLLPPVLSRKPELRQRRRQAVEFLNRLQPVVQRKIELSLAAAGHAAGPSGPAPEAAEKWYSRHPGRSIHLVQKTYAVASHYWRVRTVGGFRKAVDARRQELQAWLLKTASDVNPLLDAEYGVLGALALRAKLENPKQVPGSLVRYLHAHAHHVKAELASAGQHQAPVDMEALASQWKHPPRAPEKGVGVGLPPPLVGLDGKAVERTQERGPRYSTLALLGVPSIEVQLDDVPGAFRLETPVHYEHVPYLFNLFGGSAARMEGSRFEDIQDPSAGGAKKGPKLVGIRACDLLPDAPFMKFLARMLPNKESWWYFQRLFKPSPPSGIPGLGAADHVLQGEFRVMVMPDQPDRPRDAAGRAPVHPFQLSDEQGRAIALQPYDGCGFIKASLAEGMVAYRRAMGLDGPSAAEPDEPPWKMAPLGEARLSHLSLSAMQHYGPNDAVAQEMVEHLQQRLPELLEKHELQGETMFRCAVSGLMQGRSAVLVASTDGRAHLPRAKSRDYDGHSVLIAKSPFDNPNMVVFEPGQIATEDAQEPDATAQFLGRCGIMQYSSHGVEDAVQEVGQEARRGEQDDARKPWFGMKGLDIVVPDALWPAAYAGCDRVASAKDPKVHSHWQNAKAPVQRDTLVQSLGDYKFGDFYAPGSAVALPLETIRRLGADCDGDLVQLFMGRPALCRHVQQAEQERQAHPKPSFKPPKTHTPAIDAGTGIYDVSRTEQILSIYKNVIETFTGLQVSLLAQTPETRQWLAERAVLGTYEGMDGKLRKGVWEQLEEDEPAREAVGRLARQAAVGTQKAHYEPARQMAGLLEQLLRRWEQELNPQAGPGEQDAPALPEGAVRELLPHLEEHWLRAHSTRRRIEVVLDNYPRCRLAPPEDSWPGLPLGYDPADLHSSLENLLSIGIKVGTDSYKSDTAAGTFSECGDWLKRLFRKAPGLQAVPYTKGSGRRLAAGRLDAQETLDRLQQIPNLAAQVMHRCAGHLVEQGLWPAAPGVPPITEAVRAEAQGVANELREKALAAEPDITGLMNRLVDRVGAKLVLKHKTVRSLHSLSEELLLRGRKSYRGGGLPPSLEQLATQVGDTLRYVVEIAPEHLGSRTRRLLDELEGNGHARVNLHDRFRQEGATNKGISAQRRAPGGQVFQVEFHIPESLAVKEKLHHLYKLSQAEKLKDRPDETLLREYAERMREACSKVVTPPGLTVIREYEEFVAPSQRVGKAGPPRLGNPGRGSNDKASTRLARKVDALAKWSETTISDAVRKVAGRLGGLVTMPLVHADPAKTFKSIRSKIERKFGQPSSPSNQVEAAAKVLDALRYAFVVEQDASRPEVFWARCRSVLDELQAAGMTQLRGKDAFRRPLAPDNPYQGINATFMDAQGQAFEVQLHTAASAKAKEKSHTAYKSDQSRTARGRASSQKDLDQLSKAWQGVKAPPVPEDGAAIPVLDYDADPEVWEEYREKLRVRLAL